MRGRAETSHLTLDGAVEKHSLIIRPGCLFDILRPVCVWMISPFWHDRVGGVMQRAVDLVQRMLRVAGRGMRCTCAGVASCTGAAEGLQEVAVTCG